MTMHCACNLAERECGYPNCHTGKKMNKTLNAPTPPAQYYTTAMGEAGEAYIKSKAYNGEYKLPAQFKWQEMWNVMQGAAPTPPACEFCNDTGEIDSGGTMPWGAPAMVACHNCNLTSPAQEMNLNDIAMQRIHEAAKNGRCKDFPGEYSGNDLISDICHWLSQPAQEDDPVYQWKHNPASAWWFDCKKEEFDDKTSKSYPTHKLYRRPADDKLRKAAEELEDAVRDLEGTEIEYPKAIRLSKALKNLRAALEGK